MAHEKDISFRHEETSWIFELMFAFNLEFNFGNPQIIEADLPTVLDYHCDKVIRMMDLITSEYVIFHSEFQTYFSKDFYYRNRVYDALLEKKFELNVIQMLFNLMPEAWQGITDKQFDGKRYWFRVFNFCEHTAETFLNCKNPFNIIAAVLGLSSNRIEVVEAIVKRLNELNLTEQELRIYERKLQYLCDYRDLTTEFNFRNNMFEIKILTENERLKMSSEAGELRGEKRGEIKGETRGVRKTIISLYLDGTLTLQKAAEKLKISEVEFLTLLNNPEYK